MIITIASAKGGVGKSTLCVNMASYLSRYNKTLLYDSDVGSSVVHIFFNRYSRYNIVDFIEGRQTLDEIKLKLNPNLDLISSPFGTPRISDDDRNRVNDEIVKDSENYKYTIIDTHPGSEQRNLDIIALSDIVFIIINEEPQSIMDNYYLVKAIRMQCPKPTIFILPNKFPSQDIAIDRVNRFNKSLAACGLQPISYVGFIKHHQNVYRSVVDKLVLLENDQDSAAAQEIIRVINSAIAQRTKEEEDARAVPEE